ncbi:LysR family transcriptional regulator [Phenylobacterium sp.]|uniref:LysR family transcriptional regulator n=1 Tax=Phenylobacterium sp. TaxID=1871053 RepID=UPI00273773A2|nr:LysR family transcriptional regulator [Phenylobacterium sp.]MDP3660297.1 LysR family transcriptional regulator [Phenylobacterium sp.]
MFDWDDLRVFLAAARTGSLAGAGERLRVDAATVGRRVARLESALKSTLVIRSPAGLQLTAAGAQLLEIALDAETAMLAAAHVARPDVVAGTVRISTAEGFGTAVLAPALPRLVELYPGLKVELAANASFLSASRREVDMTVTLSAPDTTRLIVEALAPYQLALYASREYLARAGAPRSIAALPDFQIVGYVEDLIFAPELRYLDEILPGLKPTMASSSIQAQRGMVLAGGGIGVLPAFMSEGLVRVLDSVMLERRLWLSTHRDVHDTARMRAVRRWLRELAQGAEARLMAA